MNDHELFNDHWVIPSSGSLPLGPVLGTLVRAPTHLEAVLNVFPVKPVVGNSTYGVTTTFFGLLVDMSIMTNRLGVSTSHWFKGLLFPFIW